MPLIAESRSSRLPVPQRGGRDADLCAGPSAVLTALALGRLPTDAFFFRSFRRMRKGHGWNATAKALKEVARHAGFY